MISREVFDDETQVLQALIAEFKKEAIRRANEEGATDQAPSVVIWELAPDSSWRDEIEVLGKDAFPGKGQRRYQEATSRRRGAFY